MNTPVLVAQITGNGFVQLYDVNTKLLKRTLNVQGASSPAAAAIVTGDTVVVTHANGRVTTYNAQTGSYRGLIPGGGR